MKIGWNTWEPGLITKTQTSAGGAAWTNFLFRRLRQAGHEIVMLQGEAPIGTTKINEPYGIHELDVAVFCWRWSMPDYAEREEAYKRQWKLIELMDIQGVPILVHDQDHKISTKDRVTLHEVHATITAPQFFASPGSAYEIDKSLFFPNPYAPPALRFGGLEASDLTYVGNNYERFNQVVGFIAPFSQVFRTDFWGNWLEVGPYRETPSEVRNRLPDVNFHGRATQADVLTILSRSNSTIHFAKDSYLDAGFITIRWAEAVAAGIPAFIPAGMKLPAKYARQFARSGLLVESGEQMIAAYDKIRANRMWHDALQTQIAFVYEYMRVEPWLEILTGLAKKGRK